MAHDGHVPGRHRGGQGPWQDAGRETGSSPRTARRKGPSLGGPSRVGRPCGVILHGKKREHGWEIRRLGGHRGESVPEAALVGKLLRAIMACNS